MATNELQGSLLLHEFSEDDGVTWKVLVCAQAGRISSNSNITSESTKCGPIPGVGLPDWSTSGDGVANFEPTVGQVSLTDIMRWIQGTTKIRMRVQSPADGSFDIGEKYYREGEGYISTNEEDFSDGSVVKFSWEFNGAGLLAYQKIGVAALTTPVAVATGNTLTINATVSGGSEPYTYQWEKDGTPISGATSEDFVKANAQPADSGTYTLVATDAGNNTIESSGAVVTVS